MHPFNIVAVYDIGYSWDEAELIIKKYAEENNIEGEELEKMLSKEREVIVKPDRFDPPIPIADDTIFEIEPHRYTGTNGEPLNIYQLIKECGYDNEEAEIILNQYCDRMGYDERRRKKVFLEWSVY